MKAGKFIGTTENVHVPWGENPLRWEQRDVIIDGIRYNVWGDAVPYFPKPGEVVSKCGDAVAEYRQYQEGGECGRITKDYSHLIK